MLRDIQSLDGIEDRWVVDDLSVDLKLGTLSVHEGLDCVGQLMLWVGLEEVVECCVGTFVVSGLLLDHCLEGRQCFELVFCIIDVAVKKPLQHGGRCNRVADIPALSGSRTHQIIDRRGADTRRCTHRRGL